MEARYSTQWWFDALDQRRIGQPGRSWVALVAGVYADASDVWIQVVAAGDPARNVVLHIAPRTTINDVVMALGDVWSDGSTDHPVIHLAPAA